MGRGATIAIRTGWLPTKVCSDAWLRSWSMELGRGSEASGTGPSATGAARVVDDFDPQRHSGDLREGGLDKRC